MSSGERICPFTGQFSGGKRLLEAMSRAVGSRLGRPSLAAAKHQAGGAAVT